MSEANSSVAPKKNTQPNIRFGKIKMWLLYILVGGLTVSALIAIVGVLIGDFNKPLQKSLGTTLIFVTHSLFILGLIWSDTHGRIGRSIVPTTLLATSLANIVTTTLSTWGIISGQTAGDAFMFYCLAIGSSFLIAGINRLKVNDKVSSILISSTSWSVVAWSLAITPWIFSITERFSPVYYRVIGALVILMSTLFVVSIIMRTVAASRNPQLRAEARTKAKQHPVSGGLIAYYIVIGIVVSFMWLAGMVDIIDDSTDRNYYNQPVDRSIRR